MPRHRDFRLFDRPPSYGFEQFDELMRELRAALPDTDVVAEVLATLQLEGRQLDAHQLAHDLHLSPTVVEVVEQLAAWGDRGELLYEFGSICISTITAGSLLGHTDLATFIFAQRRERGFAVMFEDENGGHGELGEFERPLSLLEVVIVTDGALLRQAPYDASDGDWRSGYLGDASMTVRVSSSYYPQLSAWYEQAIAEWIAAHPVDADGD